MGHRETLMDHNWRLEQLKFLFSYGLCEMPNVGIELACKYLILFLLLFVYTVNV